ncbi:MAG: dicarboxylate/amino acid:cation symporter [Planctomycetota bacterium]
MSFHWKVLLWMAAGAVCGFLMQTLLAAPSYAGLRVDPDGQQVTVRSVAPRSPAAAAQLSIGQQFEAAIVRRGSAEQSRIELRVQEDLDERVVAPLANGEVFWLVPAGNAAAAAADSTRDPLAGAVAVTATFDPSSPLATAIAPFAFAADIFLALLKMLIVPIVLTSIITGVASVGTMGDLRRLGTKTFAYYVTTSLLAIVVGQVLVNVIRPGDGATLGLSPLSEAGATPDASFVDVLKRMIPSNIAQSLTDNGAMLSIIFFALIFGFFITRTDEPHQTRVRELFESLFEVIMSMAEGILKLLPYGVFALLVKVVASTGFAPFKALLLYMVTVSAALVIHAVVTLPILLRGIGGIRPSDWFRAMSPALMTAFSTSSSSMTLPVTLKTVEERGRVSNRVTSFTLPLGATINMDGTALYECIGVIFLAQYYAAVGDYELTLGSQALVVVLALLASVGAAGIPSAGLVMMLTILSALKLPLEGAALLLAVDRPLDMMRTVVNVWSDSCAAAVVARSEGEEGPLQPATA